MRGKPAKKVAVLALRGLITSQKKATRRLSFRLLRGGLSGQSGYTDTCMAPCQSLPYPTGIHALTAVSVGLFQDFPDTYVHS